eukprot:2130413-Alexandrium_andersonii.AAC.1
MAQSAGLDLEARDGSEGPGNWRGPKRRKHRGSKAGKARVKATAGDSEGRSEGRELGRLGSSDEPAANSERAGAQLCCAEAPSRSEQSRMKRRAKKAWPSRPRGLWALLSLIHI